MDKDLNKLFNSDEFNTLKEEAIWIRNDIKSKELDEKVKIVLLSLSDEELVRRVNNAEDELILAKLESRINFSKENLKSYSLDDLRKAIKKRKNI